MDPNFLECFSGEPSKSKCNIKSALNTGREYTVILGIKTVYPTIWLEDLLWVRLILWIEILPPGSLR